MPANRALILSAVLPILGLSSCSKKEKRPAPPAAVVVVEDDWRLPRPQIRADGTKRDLLELAGQPVPIDATIEFPETKASVPYRLEIDSKCGDHAHHLVIDRAGAIPVRSLVSPKKWQTANDLEGALECRIDFKGVNTHGSQHLFSIPRLVVSELARLETLMIRDRGTGNLLVGRRKPPRLSASEADTWELAIGEREFAGQVEASLHCDHFENHRRFQSKVDLAALISGPMLDSDLKPRREDSRDKEIDQTCRIVVASESGGPMFSRLFPVAFPRKRVNVSIHIPPLVPSPGDRLVLNPVFTMEIHNSIESPVAFHHELPSKPLKLQTVYFRGGIGYVGEVMSVPYEFEYSGFASEIRNDGRQILRLRPNSTGRIQAVARQTGYTCSFRHASATEIEAGGPGFVGFALASGPPFVLSQFDDSEGLGLDRPSVTVASLGPADGTSTYLFLPSQAWREAKGDAQPALEKSPDPRSTSSCYDLRDPLALDWLIY